jgi:aminopeptidase-like protein
VADRAARYALGRIRGEKLQVREFDPGDGSDERQYCSPGFNLPVAVICRSMYGQYAGYHTSQDNRDYISFPAMVESVDAAWAVLRVLDRNCTYRRTLPYGEPQLGRHGLYPTLSTRQDLGAYIKGMCWLLNLADGKHDLLAMAERSGYDFWLLDEAAAACMKAGILTVE